MNTYQTVVGKASIIIRWGDRQDVPVEAINRLDMAAFNRYILQTWPTVLDNDEERMQFFNIYRIMRKIIIRLNPDFDHIGIDDPNISALIRSAVNCNDRSRQSFRKVFNYIMAERFGVDAYQQQF